MIEAAANELIPFINDYNTAIANARMFFSDHPQVKSYVSEAHQKLRQLLSKRSALTLMIVDERLVADNTPIKGAHPGALKFIENLREQGIESLTFLSGISDVELHKFIQQTATGKNGQIATSNHIRFGKIEVASESDHPQQESQQIDEIDENERQLGELGGIYQQELSTVDEVFGAIDYNTKPDVDRVAEVVKNFIDGFTHAAQPLDLLTTLKYYDEYTFTHVINVCVLTLIQAESLGFKGRHLHEIGMAAALHDVGKLFIPDEIINKPGTLTPEEQKIMRTHAVLGARYLIRHKGIPRLAAIAALEHHLKFDGSGYPKMGKGWRQNIISQVVAIADIFDAMRSWRPYRKPVPQKKILSIIQREKGTAFNPILVDNFMRLLER